MITQPRTPPPQRTPLLHQSTDNKSFKTPQPNTLRQKSYPKAVDNHGHIQPDETSPRKSYATIIASGAADNQIVSPLGQKEEAWLPLASMAKDPPPENFVQSKDHVPPDRSHTPPRQRRRRTRRKSPPSTTKTSPSTDKSSSP